MINQISEDFARDLLSAIWDISSHNRCNSKILSEWKQKGYIEQSNSVPTKLRGYYGAKSKDIDKSELFDKINEIVDYLSILDNKIKELSNE